tara:strand:+ start:335 stop:667 length:333 start_codon:yes stop_codon:yes gene_type:complete
MIKMTIDQLARTQFQERQFEISEQMFKKYIGLIKKTNRTSLLKPAISTLVTTGSIAASLLYISNLSPRQIIEYSLGIGIACAIGKVSKVIHNRNHDKLCFYRQIGREYDY